MGMIILINLSFQGKNNYTGGSGRFRPRNAKKSPRKKKRPPENCHRLQCKSLSVHSVQCCRFSQWDVKSNPRHIFFFFGLPPSSFMFQNHNLERGPNDRKCKAVFQTLSPKVLLNWIWRWFTRFWRSVEWKASENKLLTNFIIQD